MVPDPDIAFMNLALAQARMAAAIGEVPVGAVVVRGDEVVAAGHNLREQAQDPTAHAELLAIRAAARATGSWRLVGCTVYVTLEPCAMCTGGLVLARVERCVFAAPDPKAGFMGSLGDLARDARLNHRIDVTSGVCQAEASALLSGFFRDLRRRGPV